MTRKFDVNDKYPLQTAFKIADKEFFPNLHVMQLPHLPHCGYGPVHLLFYETGLTGILKSD